MLVKHASVVSSEKVAVVSEDLESRLSNMGSLMEPARRALFLYVASETDAVSREQAAEALTLPHHTVKFHLDRLVEEGLLTVEFRRLSGRSGPGAGRPAKLYRPVVREVSVSLPERRYDLLGSLLAQAVDDSVRDGAPITDAVREVAEHEGARIGEEWASTGGADLPCLDRICGALTGYGFQPSAHEGTVTLANCPFHRMSEEHTDLVCGMNLALITSMVAALECTGVDVELDPEPGRCCVLIHDETLAHR